MGRPGDSGAAPGGIVMMEPTLSIVVPAYNEAPRIEPVLKGLQTILSGQAYEIIVVDDGSTDETREVAEGVEGVTVVRNPQRKGYGGAIKTGVRKAKGEWILLVDADGQHQPSEIPKLLEHKDRGDMIVGSREGESLYRAGRLFGRTVVRRLAEFLVESRIPDLNSGLRLVRRELFLDRFSLLPNGFSLSTTLTLALLKSGYTVVFVPVTVTAREGSSSRVRIFRDSIRTILLMVRITTMFNPLKVFLPMSCFLWFLGLVYLIEEIVRGFNIADGAVLLIIAGTIIFFFGILADQLSTLQREIHRRN